MNSEPTEDPLDRAKAQIRADAGIARQSAPLPPRIAQASRSTAEDDAPPATQVSIAELAQYSGLAFVENAYRLLLRRGSDTPGLEHQMRVLGSGAGKIEIIGDMRYSAEGRSIGVQVPGLLPRYFFAKLGRVPVLGFFVQWLGALAALPHMLRYQRANEASLAVRFHETANALRASEQRDIDIRAVLEAGIDASLEEHRNEAARLDATLHLLRLRIEAIESRIPDPDVIELRRLVLSMNHWTVKVREGIRSIEAAHASRRAAANEIVARDVREARLHDAKREPRLRAWAAELKERLKDSATVLDLCSGADWLSELAALRLQVNGIDSNQALHGDLRESTAPVALGDSAALLARTADQSLDALTIASADRIRAEM
ncbi:MAG: hypothetical protein ACREPX_07320, partial [Rhodanobacteraceae bacterium]